MPSDARYFMCGVTVVQAWSCCHRRQLVIKRWGQQTSAATAESTCDGNPPTLMCPRHGCGCVIQRSAPLYGSLACAKSFSGLLCCRHSCLSSLLVSLVGAIAWVTTTSEDWPAFLGHRWHRPCCLVFRPVSHVARIASCGCVGTCAWLVCPFGDRFVRIAPCVSAAALLS